VQNKIIGDCSVREVYQLAENFSTHKITFVDEYITAKSEDDLQYSVYSLNITA
jgi:hypothetical protein